MIDLLDILKIGRDFDDVTVIEGHDPDLVLWRVKGDSLSIARLGHPPIGINLLDFRHYPWPSAACRNHLERSIRSIVLVSEEIREEPSVRRPHHRGSLVLPEREVAELEARTEEEREFQKDRREIVYWNGSRAVYENGHDAAMFPPGCNVSFPKVGTARAARRYCS